MRSDMVFNVSAHNTHFFNAGPRQS